jgi:hypothetical protein
MVAEYSHSLQWIQIQFNFNQDRFMIKKIILLVLISFISIAGKGQYYRIEGRILDAQTHIPVPNAEIKFNQKHYVSDNKGYFSGNQIEGTYTVSVKQTNFAEMTKVVSISSDTTLIIYYDKIVSIDEVTVSGSRISGFKKDDNLEITRLTPAEISFLPGLGSTDDVLKKIQLMPGIQSGYEGSSGLIVRGGQYDQNLFNLNGFPIYQPFHFSGLISSIDPFVVSDVEIMKGGFPSRYGGKLSSVVNFNTNKTISDSVLTTIEAGILVSGAATRFSPDSITTISVSGRIGTTMPLNKSLNRIIPIFPFYNFYDLNLNASRKLNDKNDLSLTFFMSKDYMNSSSTFTDLNKGIKSTVENIAKAGWNDMLAGISWTNKANENLKIQTNLFYQNFLTESTEEIHSVIYDTNNTTEDAINKNSSLIKEFGLTNDYETRVGGHNFNFGIFSYFRTISPIVGTFLYKNGELTSNPEVINNPTTSYFQVESGVYFEDQYTINNKTTIRPGIRLSVLTDFKSNFISPEPRLFISHKLNDKVSLIGSYTITTQSIHRVSSSNAMVVNDLWLPAKGDIKPSKSYQSEFGVFYNSGRFFQAEVNFYNKQMKDLSIYKDGASFVLYPRWEDNITTAIGKSYGAEFLIQTHLKNTFILLAYTLSKTTRQAPDVNGGKVFNYRYDKPHNLNLTIGYRANRKLTLSCNWVIQSGNMISFYDRIIQADYQGPPIPFLDKVNNIRFPIYNRLDFGIERRKTTKWGKKVLKIDIYNVYSKLNPWYLTVKDGSIEQVTLFPIIPSVSYRVEF